MPRLSVGLGIALSLVLGGAALGASPESFPIAPYTDQRYLLTDGSLSVYSQPWRGYLETRPARELAAGVGMNYNLPADANHDAVIGLLASVGVRHLRIEMPFSAIGADGRLKPGETAVFDAFLRATKKYGIRPLVLLNGHSGAPGPHTSVRRQLVAPAASGARVLVLDDVSGLVPGRSGLSYLTEYRMTEVLFTAIDPLTRTVVLSRPLPVDLPAGDREIHTLAYAPLHPVGTPQYEHSLGGWLAYGSTVLDVLAAHGIANFDVEVWNELSFGSHWLRLGGYYDPAPAAPDFLLPGGTAWELGRRTVDLVTRRAPQARVIWGFSNTTFFHTPPEWTPAGTDGQSYHPYGTGIHQFPDGLDLGARWEYGHVPTLRKVMPEGWAHLGSRHEQLLRSRLSPTARTIGPTGDTGRFHHFMTEHGIAPREIGITDWGQAQQLKAAATLRALGFWLNKGIDVMDVYSAYDTDPTGMGMLRGDVAPRDYGSYTRDQLLTPQLRALANFTAPLAGATTATPGQITVTASSYGPQPQVFAAGPDYPALPYRELLTLLPFQVSTSKVVVGAYVMSYDVTNPPPPMTFQIGLGKLPFDRARVSLLDPLTGTTTAVTTKQGAKGEVVVDLTLDDRFRWLVVEPAAGTSPRPSGFHASSQLARLTGRLPSGRCEIDPVVTSRCRPALASKAR